jgi:two-component system cell cycle response regulator
MKTQSDDKIKVSMGTKDFSIIIVDDLQFSRIVVKTALKKAGYDGVRMADSASEALRMLEEEQADVVLADWMMPEMNGLELTDRIRQTDEEKGIYTAIILFTANEGIEYLVEAFDHGVDDYLRKPPNPHELAARVNSAARLSMMQNDMLETSRQMQQTIARLQKTALLDDLTDAGNERMLNTELEAHLQEASTRNGGVCLAMVELNELSNVREMHDEQAEKDIVISLYRRLRRTVRPTDIVTRLDGNIFGIIMHHSDMSTFKMSALDRIRTAINQRTFKIEGDSLKMTASIGVNYYSGDNPVINTQSMIKQAKENLAKAIKNEEEDIVS